MDVRLCNCARVGLSVGVASSANKLAVGPVEDSAVLQHSLAPDQSVLLPWLADGWLHESMARLTPDECEAMLRDKVIACGWLPGETLVAVAEHSPSVPPPVMRRSIIGWISRKQYQELVRRHFGQSLLALATHGLAKSMPWASAHVRLSTGQILAISIAAVFASSLAALGQLLALQVVVQLALGTLFAVVVMLRLWCLAPRPTRHFARAQPLRDADLPVYTVLVPLFRETEVLRQLLGALRTIDYPALCSNSTKRSESPWASFAPWNSLKSSIP